MVSALPLSDTVVGVAALVGTVVFGIQTIIHLIAEVRYRRIRRYAMQDSGVGRLASELLPSIERVRTRKGNGWAALARAMAGMLSSMGHLWRVIALWISRL